MRIAMLGTRGVPAAYGGFETAVEEVGKRLAERGHEVTVYGGRVESDATEYLGMRVVQVPALRQKQLETLSRTGIASVITAIRGTDAAFVFNSANAPYVPLLRARRIPVAVHVDGLEWRRAKWGRAGRAYYRWAEQAAVRSADALISDAPGIAEYYQQAFGAPTALLRYGAPILDDPRLERVRELGLEPGRFHLVVARFEPENHVLEIVQGLVRSDARLPLAVVGSAPYSHEYTEAVRSAGAGDDRVRLLGGVWDQELLDALYAGARTYIHGHSVGGTNPSLLRAMGAGAAIVPFDVDFNTEVIGSSDWTFRSSGDLPAIIAAAETDDAAVAARGKAARERARTAFRWDDVADGYEQLAASLRERSVHPQLRRARRRQGT